MPRALAQKIRNQARELVGKWFPAFARKVRRIRDNRSFLDDLTSKQSVKIGNNILTFYGQTLRNQFYSRSANGELAAMQKLLTHGHLEKS